MLIELTDHSFEGIVLGKSLNCLIVRDSSQQYHLISKYALKNPDEFNFKSDIE